MAVSAQSRHKEAAYLFSEWATSKQSCNRELLGGVGVGRASTWGLPEIKARPRMPLAWYQAYQDSLKIGRPGLPEIVDVTQYRDIIGLANYAQILTAEARFREAFFRTLYFAALVVAAETVLGVAMALLFNREFWGRGLIRTLSILPMVATPTAVALIFVMMYHPTLGVMNYLVTRVGLGPFTWTYSSRTALYALALVDVWEWTPLIMLIALAGLAALPKEPYESAVIDGATGLGTLRHIT